jgi:DinB superfamily
VPYLLAMKPDQIIQQLEANRLVFQSLFAEKEEKQYRWKPDDVSWSLLEIVCHLYDEELEDFRTRVFNTLFTPDQAPPSIDPQGWVLDRKYNQQDYTERVNAFLSARNDSIKKLRELKQPRWENAYHHPALGPISAYQFLTNWLAHDYHHIRQVNRRLYEYLKESSGIDLTYAGVW